MKNISKIIFLILVMQWSFAQEVSTEKTKVNTVLNKWHQAASNANFKAYFGMMTADAVFIGTDATENWGLDAFKKFSKPYFDAGKAWDFKTLERNIFIRNDVAWFDELLDTQMEICRGSGVLVKEGGVWKIKHYVLSIAIPNENVNEVTKLKTIFDQKLKEQLRK